MVTISKKIPLAPYTTFKIGGPAKYFAEAKSREEIIECVKWARRRQGFGGQAKNNPPAGGLPVFVLGGGSNILVSDKGFNGLVIKIKNLKLKIKNFEIEVEAGVPLAKVVSGTANAGLSGLEWAIGIPGTIGGAVCGNAGAFGRETANAVESVSVLDTEDLSVKEFSKADCKFAYRESVFKHNFRLVIISAILKMEKSGTEDVRKKMISCAKERAEGFSGAGAKCAGSYFKNIEWTRSDINKSEVVRKYPELEQFKDKPKIAAGFLIDFMNLKGKKIGGAEVSDKHANFIVNGGKATAKEVVKLAALIKKKVSSRYGFDMKEEVCLVGF